MVFGRGGESCRGVVNVLGGGGGICRDEENESSDRWDDGVKVKKGRLFGRNVGGRGELC